MKRILIVATTFETFKAFMSGYIQALDKEFDVTICAAPTNSVALDWVPSTVAVIKIPIRRKISVLTDFICLLKLLQLSAFGSYFMVHTITPKASLLGQFAAFICRVPVRLHTFTGQIWASKKGFNRAAYRYLDKRIAALTTDLLSDSHAQKEFLVDERICSPRKISVLWNGSVAGVDLERFRPSPSSRTVIRSKHGFEETDFVLLFLGRIVRDKGVLELIQAFELATQRCSRLKLLMVGPDEQGFLNDGGFLKHLTTEIACEGRTDYPEQYFVAADLFCLPSYREGFGNVIIEAAACGLPSLVSDVYGLKDAVVDGKTGLVHPARDFEALSHSIIQVYNDRRLYRRLGTAARRRAIANFDSRIFVRHQMSFVRQLISSRS